jgi:cytochrome c-type biogenesis protein CcmH/NrfG
MTSVRFGDGSRRVGRRPGWTIALIASAGTAVAVALLWTRPSLERAARLDAARRSLANHDDRTAATTLEPLVRRNPADGEAAFLLARACRRSGNRQRAARLLALARSGGAIPELVDLEEALLRLGAAGPAAARDRETETGEAKALRLAADTGHPEAAIIYEALVADAIGSFAMARAHELASAWISASPHDWLPRVRRGDIRARFSLGSEARDDYVAAISLRFDAPGAHAGLGTLLVRQLGDAVAAEPHLRQAIRDDPGDTSCQTALAEALLRIARAAEARAVLDRVLDSAARDPQALRLRGILDLEEGRADAAVDSLERADALEPGNLETVASLSRALALAGHPAQARAAEARLVTLRQEAESLDPLIKRVLAQPDDAEVRYRIGATLVRMGRLDDARNWLASAVAYAPDHEEALAALASLDASAKTGPTAPP